MTAGGEGEVEGGRGGEGERGGERGRGREGCVKEHKFQFCSFPVQI